MADPFIGFPAKVMKNKVVNIDINFLKCSESCHFFSQNFEDGTILCKLK